MAQMRLCELAKSSLAELLTIIESQPGKYRHIFRGQGNARWGLVPSLYRQKSLSINPENLKESYGYFEQSCIERFFSEGMPYLPPLKRSFATDRIIAQHFGVPTRFLDWSRDPLVATFFAVEDWEHETDGAVYMLLPDCGCLLDLLTAKYLDSSPHKAIRLEPPAIDRRIPAQKSVFTVHQYGQPNAPFVPLDDRPDIGNEIHNCPGTVRGFAKIIIPSKRKRAIYQTLLTIGIDRRNLFPGLDGVGADVAQRAHSGQI